MGELLAWVRRIFTRGARKPSTAEAGIVWKTTIEKSTLVVALADYEDLRLRVVASSVVKGRTGWVRPPTITWSVMRGDQALDGRLRELDDTSDGAMPTGMDIEQAKRSAEASARRLAGAGGYR